MIADSYFNLSEDINKFTTSFHAMNCAGELCLESEPFSLINDFIDDVNTSISGDEYLLESFKAGFFSQSKKFVKNGLVLRHFQVRLWLEAMSYHDRL